MSIILGSKYSLIVRTQVINLARSKLNLWKSAVHKLIKFGPCDNDIEIRRFQKSDPFPVYSYKNCTVFRGTKAEIELQIQGWLKMLERGTYAYTRYHPCL